MSKRVVSVSSSSPSAALRRRFVFWWLTLFTVHGVCIAYFVRIAILYKKLPKLTLAYYFRAYSIGIPEKEYPKIVLIHQIIAAIHGFFMLLMIVGSIQVRQLAFYPTWAWFWYLVHGYHKVKQRLWTKVHHDRVKSSLTSSRTLSTVLHRAHSTLFGRRGFTGIDFVYFDHMLLVRELIETSLQTYQAYRMTLLLPRFWLIRVYVVLLIANCWAVPILHRIYSKRHRLRRLMSLICDVILDLLSSMGISFIIFCAYAPQYTDPHFGFPLKNFYDDKWFINLYQEFQMMVVVSWADMISRLVFAFGVLQCMDSIKQLIDDMSVPSTGTTTSIKVISVVPANDAVTQPPLSRKGSSHLNIHSRFHRPVHFILHVVAPACFVVYGIMILAVHIYAEAQHIDSPCKLPLRPWLSADPGCSLLEIDCYQLDASGSLGTLDKYWTAFKPALATGLVIRHCPELIIPTSMPMFTNIITIKTYNSTVASWSDASGLTAVAHGRLRAVYFVRTNFTDGVLPAGLMRKDFPQTFSSIFMSKTNLVALPPTLDLVWPKRMTIAIEFAAITSVPDVLMRLNPSTLSLTNSPITSLPSALFEIPAMKNLILSYIPLNELPRHVAKLGPSLYSLSLEGTNISAFWGWMDPFITRSLALRPDLINAAFTPFCIERAEIVKGTRDRFSAWTTETNLAKIMNTATPSQLAYAQLIGCKSQVPMSFPLAIEDARSGLHKS